MKFTSSFRDSFIYMVALLHIVLFSYAAVSKILDFENFQVQLGQSPLLSAYAGIVSYAVVVGELLISGLLAFPMLRRIGLLLSFSLMVLFTTYIIIILNFSSFIPCSCGGILEKLGWTEHLIFNNVFVLLSLCALLLYDRTQKSIVTLLGTFIVSSLFVVFLYGMSEATMQKENPFVRRFTPNIANRSKALDLKNYGYYFAGVDKGKIYLGNTFSPLTATVVDDNLNQFTQFPITLDRDDLPFRAARLKIRDGYFFVYDGYVPVIYRGSVSNWKASTWLSGKPYFTVLEPTDSVNLIFRSQQMGTYENVLGRITQNDKTKITKAPQLLQKQIDGIFDTDGTMAYSEASKTFVYTYFYRNQYIVTNDKLELLYRGKTIDTTDRAQLKVVRVKKSGDAKLAAPPYTVNLRTTLYRNLLFVQSGLLGRFENKKIWKDASIIDIYDITKKAYVGSCYVYHENHEKLTDFIATDTGIYAINGHQLVNYKFGKPLLSHLKASD